MVPSEFSIDNNSDANLGDSAVDPNGSGIFESPNKPNVEGS